MWILQVIDVRGKLLEEHALGEGLQKIGRAPDNHVVLRHEGISRWHAEITVAGNACEICDKGSASGLLLNGERVDRAAIQDGDIVQIGDKQLKFHWGDAQEIRVPAQSPASATHMQLASTGQHSLEGARSKAARIAVWLALLLIAAMTWWYGTRPSAAVLSEKAPIVERASLPKRVEVGRYQNRSFVREWEGVGNVRFQVIQAPASRPAPIQERLVQLGDEVEKDQLLATLDERCFAPELAEVQASLQKTAQVGKILEEKLKFLSSQQKKAEYHLYLDAQAQLLENRAQEQILVRKSERISQEREIRAPAAGMVAQINQEGTVPVIVLLDRRDGIVAARVSETEALGLDVGQDAFAVSDSSGIAFCGRLERLEKNVRLSDHTREVEISLDGLYAFSLEVGDSVELDRGRIPDLWRAAFVDPPLSQAAAVEPKVPGAAWRIQDSGAEYLCVREGNSARVYRKRGNAIEILCHGSAVRIRVLVGRRVDVPSVPKASVLPSGTRPTGVYVVRDIVQSGDRIAGKARFVPVETGYGDEDFCEFRSAAPDAVDRQTWIITRGQSALSDGDSVEAALPAN